MRVVNPRTGATIVGEAGDDIGRSGRSLLFFKDESGHCEYPEMIEAALLANAAVQMDISSVPGAQRQRVFQRRRENGVEWVPASVPPLGQGQRLRDGLARSPGKDSKLAGYPRIKDARRGYAS
jgi:hypothetical protein